MLLRRVARPLLAGIFIQSGVATLRDPKSHADMAAPVLDRVVAVAPVEDPPDNTTLVQIEAGVKIGAGVLLAIGKAPRLSSVMLAATLIPTTAAQHRFWETEDPNQRANQQLHFTKNLALLGGLMLASADTEGKPSLAWRARRARRTSAAAAELFHRDVTEGVSALPGQLAERAGQLTGDLAKAATRASGQAGALGKDVATRTSERIAPAATRAGERISARTGQLLSDADTFSTAAIDSALDQARRSKTIKDARKAAKKARKRAAKRLNAASNKASKRVEHATKQLEQAGKRTSEKVDRAGRVASERLGRSA